jgi:hypothetical protein
VTATLFFPVGFPGGVHHQNAKPYDISGIRSSQAFFDGVKGVAAEVIEGFEKGYFFVLAVYLPQVGSRFEFV